MIYVRIATDFGDVAEWAAALGTAVFLVQYTIYAKWWKNFIGRSVVLLDVCLLGILIPAVIQLARPELAMRWFDTRWYLTLLDVVLWGVVYTALSRIWGWRKLNRISKLRQNETVSEPRHVSE